MTPDETIRAYDALLERAIAVLHRGPPFWKYIGEPEYARLHIEGDEATVTWPETESSYDSWCTETVSASFPAALLTMPEVEFAAWKAKAQEDYERKRKADEEQRAREHEAKERATLAKLQRKYATR